MNITNFSDYQRGILYSLLCDAYSSEKNIINTYSNSWKVFDDFVFDNLTFMDHNGFITQEDHTPIGFISWDSRKHPEIIEIGHNCIITKYKNNGRGKKQLSEALEIIKKESPKKITVKTGNTDFFIPARKMYATNGFILKNISKSDDIFIFDTVEYEMIL